MLPMRQRLVGNSLKELVVTSSEPFAVNSLKLACAEPCSGKLLEGTVRAMPCRGKLLEDEASRAL